MPILNSRDYRVAKARLAQIRAALSPEAVFDGLKTNLSGDIASARTEALRAEIRRLEDHIATYERLQSSGDNTQDLSIDDLGTLPIIGRIARKMSQRELAERLDVSEQQIQRYESDRYSSVGLSRYKKILEVLGVEVNPSLKPISTLNQPDSMQSHQFELDAALIAAIRKSNWIQLPKGISQESAAQIVATYIEEAAELSRGRTLHRRNSNALEKRSETALAVWRARALRQSMLARQGLRTKFNLVDTTWVSKLATISSRPDGPLRAVDELREHGIVLSITPHLPGLRLDGAAMLLSDGTPAIVLTLRYDRVDSFWFTLFHEIGHVLLHFNHGLDLGFVDDLDSREDNADERAADSFAQSALIPDQTWETAPARFSRSSDLIRRLASSLRIHPAIVAGRIRRERSDYTVFSELLGTGTVRAMFADK